MTTPDTSIASRSLDIYLAKAVGYTIELRPDSVLGDVWRLIRPDGTTASVPGLLSDEERAWDYVPYFSSDRSAAFELAWAFCNIDIIVTGNEVNVQLHHTGPNEGNVTGHRDDVALLICQCALAAKGLSL